MTKCYMLLTFVQMHALLGNGKAEEINLIQSIKTEVSTSMSSTSNYLPFNVTSWYSNNSIDNKATGDPNTCGCCAGTLGSEPPWLQIDLGSVYTIRKIQITGRPYGSWEQFQNIYVYVSNTSMISSNGNLVYYGNTTTDTMFKLLQQPPISFRYLIIRRFYASILTMCEVELFEAVCDHRRFGINCSTVCNCRDNTSCYIITGHCNTGLCDPGWLGQSCDKVCDYRRFGINCSTVCNCRDNTSCNAITGHCKTGLCDPGWLGQSCDKVCDYRRFGINCSTVCNCRDNTSCNAITGHCKTGLCDPGWLGQSCGKVCDYQRFGINCSNICNCRDNTSCNAITGHCKTGLCDPGWLGLSCDKVCDYRRFGINCSNICNCRDNTSCNAITGHCKTGLCDPGWLGQSCGKGGNLIKRIKHQVSTQMSSEAQNTYSTFAIDGQLGPDPDKCQCCSITYNSPLSWWRLDLGKRYPLKSIIIYGRNKEDSYQQLTGFKLLLLNNTIGDKPEIFLSNDSLHKIEENKYEEALNNSLARYVKIERPGVLTLCEVIVIEGNCRDGTFGEECVQECHCADNKPCQTIHGYCQSPICKLGWMGKSCNESCTQSTFGEECKQKCYCKEGTCTSDYGICTSNCRYGYRGVHCNIEGIEEAKKGEHSSAAVIGGSVAGGIFVIGIILMTVLIYKQRMQQVKRNASENYYKTVRRNIAHEDDETTYDTIDISHGIQDQQNEEENVNVTGL